MSILKKYNFKIKPLYRWGLPVVAAIVILFIFSLPAPIFSEPTSTVAFDRNGKLLGARIADDGQWRFPESDSIPEKFKTCIIAFEDRHFYNHPGVNPFSLFRAIAQNISAGKVVSGASTLTMQTIRLSRKGKPRTIAEKLIEIWLSLRLEFSFSKQEILKLYTSHAPFGGNVVGLDAASWRYYGRSAHNLSWSEAATLAVLPNAPALIHPGRNRDALLKKRNTLLDRLFREGAIDSLSCMLSKQEPLPEKPLPLPENAFHLLSKLDIENHGQISNTTVDAELQKKCNAIITRHHEILSGNGIHNAALMVMRTKTGEVLAYIGNSGDDPDGIHGNQVDVITSPRSSGSILKPILFAAMLDAGDILPGTLVADIPTTISNYSPKNFNVTYDGAVAAREALIRSLNVPSVRLLSDYGQERFYHILKDAGFSTLTFEADHYGLSLILGGAEVTLWDLCKVYRGMGNTLLEYPDFEKLTLDGQFPTPQIIKSQKCQAHAVALVLGAGAIFTAFEALKEVRRPEMETGWESFLSSNQIAWKTGTSFGFRDAWAVGVTLEYTVGVWAGNADGEGRPGLTGISAAAPIMFDVFGVLPGSAWFEPPWDKLVKIAVCSKSGMRPSPFCESTDSILAPPSCLNTLPCPYHQLIHLDETEKFRVHADCYPQGKIRQKNWFMLPPAMAWFYRSKDPFYQNPPPWFPGCNTAENQPMQLIWPDKPSKIYLPKEIDGKPGAVVFEAAHQNPSHTIFWYVDDVFMGETIYKHKMSMQPARGKHKLVLVDDEGNFLSVGFEVVGKRD